MPIIQLNVVRREMAPKRWNLENISLMNHLEK